MQPLPQLGGFFQRVRISAGDGTGREKCGFQQDRQLTGARPQLADAPNSLTQGGKQADSIAAGSLSPEARRQRIDEINRWRRKAAEDAVERAKAVERRA